VHQKSDIVDVHIFPKNTERSKAWIILTARVHFAGTAVPGRAKVELRCGVRRAKAHFFQVGALVIDLTDRDEGGMWRRPGGL
jgi:hypothetical protein